MTIHHDESCFEMYHASVDKVAVLVSNTHPIETELVLVRSAETYAELTLAVSVLLRNVKIPELLRNRLSLLQQIMIRRRELH